MNAIIDAAIHHARTVISTLVLILLAGTVTFVQIPKESAPDINIPVIYVTMSHSGISPEDAVSMLVKPMEADLRTVEGVKEMRAAAYEGGANILLEFEAGFDADQAMDDVREQVDKAKTELPEETDEPIVSEVNFSLFPVIVVALSGDVPERTLLRVAENLEDAIEGVPAVLDANVGGKRDEQGQIIIDPTLVEAYGLSAQDFVTFFSGNNTLVAAGNLDTGAGRFAVKVPGLLETVPEVMDIPIKVQGDSIVRLADIAEGRHGFEDAEGFARVNGQPGLTVEVSKRTGENIIDTVAKVREVVERERQDWPDAIQVTYLQDQSTNIRDSLNDLTNNVIAAVLLVMVVVVGALGLRSGLLVGIAIPGSFLMAILVIGAAGLTINMVVLFGLILAVGMLVDGAIVVTEYADRKMSEGLHRREAYALAAKRMAWPVIASTATTLAAFLPLAFWTGVVGEFMKYLPYTLLATLTASLFMALIFVPTLGAIFGRRGESDPSVMQALSAQEEGDVRDLRGITGFYARTLDRLLKHPGKVVLAAVMLLVGSQVAYGMFGKGVEFFPSIEPEQAFLYVHARGNLSVEEKDALVGEVERAVLDMDGIESLYVKTGKNSADREAPEDVIGSVGIDFTDWQTRRPASEILDDIRDLTSQPRFAGIKVEVREAEQGPPVGKPIQVQIGGNDQDAIYAAAEKIRGYMERAGGFTDIEDTRAVPGIEWRLTVDRAQAAKFGIDIRSVGDMVKMVTNGLKFSTYRPGTADDEVDIVARYPDEYRTLDQLDRITVNTPEGSVPVGAFVEREPQPKTGEIRRVDSQQVVTVSAEVAEGLLADDKLRELQAWMASPDADLNPRLSIDFKGEDEEQAKSRAFLMKAFGVALFMMAIILVTQFNSFYSAFLILSAVIMSTIGVFLGLLAFGQPFGIIMSGIGVIALAGIVVNNNIVLIDTYDRLKHEFADGHEAILRTGVQRLRPVLLTTVTTGLGLLPMMFQVNIDFVHREVTLGAPSMQWWSQLSTALVCGLSFATVLTLVVTPSALMVRVNVRRWLDARRARRHGPQPA
ncbi:Acriflavin resistance protein [Caenispirillum salinarum AK4]|uniref:Acriflavin resistance protein n=1 Tax=Caenispirillum salinarum AK4 TaxID=1238182 RepID=K9GRW1_9PROT|nr:efflux RND transporter permease subunit [Caenispirillum salinarum]EKV28685.1 Acriflavin resistance protein [Caenispirillum salinarum AK4]